MAMIVLFILFYGNVIVNLTFKVLSVTRNLAQWVRQSFAGVSSGLQETGSAQLLSSFDSSSLSLPGSSRPRQVHSVYNFNVVLLDPGVDNIPRRSLRQELRDNGRIVQLSLARGAQQAEAWRALVSAFPLLTSIQSRCGDECFEVLVTDKTSRNILIPANAPDCGFTARELHKVAGQGSLYLRLLETLNPTQSHTVRRQRSSAGRRSSPGYVFRQTYLPGATRSDGQDLGAGGAHSASDGHSIIASPSTATISTSSIDRFSRTLMSTSSPQSNRQQGSRTATRTTSTVGTIVSTRNDDGHARRLSRPPAPRGSSSTLTTAAANIAVAGRPGGQPRVRGQSVRSSVTNTTTRSTSTVPIAGNRLNRQPRGGSLQGRSTSTITTATSTVSNASVSDSTVVPVVVRSASNSSSMSSSIHRTNTMPATVSDGVPFSLPIAITPSSSSGLSLPTNAIGIYTSTVMTNSAGGSTQAGMPPATTDTITTTDVSSASSILIGINTLNALSPSITDSGVARPDDMGVASNHEGARISSEEDEEEQLSPGRRWRATLPIEVDDDNNAGAGIETAVSGTDNALPTTSAWTPSTSTGSQFTTSITTTAVPRPSVENSTAVVTGAIELPEASVLLELLAPNQGQFASALQSSIQMTQSARLPFNHPCTFHVLMDMVRICGHSSRPALMCVCTERQWHLWRPIFENREIANVVNEQFVFWVQSSDGADGKQGLEDLKCQSTLTGMVAVVCNVDGNKKVLQKITGPPSVAELKQALEETLKAFQEHKSRWLALKAERDLKRQQDLEFQASLKADKEKELRKKNTKACQCELVKEIPSEPVNREQQRSADNSNNVEPPQQQRIEEQPQQESPDEPPAKRVRSEQEIQIAVVLPDGRRHELNMSLQNTAMELYQQVRALLPGQLTPFTLHCPLDKNVSVRICESNDTLQVLGLGRGIVVRVTYESDEDIPEDS